MEVASGRRSSTRSADLAVPVPRTSPDTDNPQLAVDLLRGILQDASDAIVALDPNRRILLFNKAAEEMFGYSAREAHGQALNALLPTRFHNVHPHHVERFVREPVERQLMSDRSELVGRRRDGAEFPVEVTISKVPTQGGVITTAIVRDITDRKLADRALEDQALHDSLTGLPNRALLSDRLTQALLQRPDGTNCALLFIDLDRFKLVNDSLGHGAGDRLLVRVGRRLEASIRAGDTAARLGGDEFVVLSPGIGSADRAAELAGRLAAAIAKPLALEGIEIFPSASIGVVVATDTDDAESLLANADAAMYQAKALGRGRYELFDQTMRDQAVERIRIESDLRRALTGDQLEVWYQPIVNLATETTIGHEALVRWQHPQRGLIAAAEFVPYAEDSGMIAELDQWVFERICTQRGDDSGQLAVNLSARWLEHSTFVDSVRRIAETSRLDPARLVFEVTESVVLADLTRASRTLHQLKELGIRLAIDDFGTGYSSLSYLHRLPLDYLKIDRSFVERLGADTRDAAMTAGIIALAQNLGLTVIAEGIETSAQHDAVMRLGCELGQGYLLGRAEPFVPQPLRAGGQRRASSSDGERPAGGGTAAPPH